MKTNYLDKALSVLLFVVSIITAVNVAMLFWHPSMLPFSLFSSQQIMFMPLGVDKYLNFALDIAICVIICAVLFISGTSVLKHKFAFPIVAMIIFIADLIDVLVVFILMLSDYSFAFREFMTVYIPYILVDALIIVLVNIYLFRHHRDSSMQIDECIEQ